MNWRKIGDLDSTYVHTNPDDISQQELCEVLRKYVKSTSTTFGANVKYGISKYIGTNQVGGEFEGFDTLFELEN